MAASRVVGILSDIGSRCAWQHLFAVPSMKLRVVPVILVFFGAIALVCSCTLAGEGRISAEGTSTASAPAAPVVAPVPTAARLDKSPDFSDSIARQADAVVNVAAIRPSPEFDRSDEEARIELFHELNPGSTAEVPPRTASRADGCGFIISSDGYIITNAHLVTGASIVNVVLHTGRAYPARLVGTDLPTDIAVLKIEARNLPVAVLGDSQHLKVGQWVAAIGAPFGFEQSAVVGVVSALERSLPGDTSYTTFIQTDLSLNPGNSGGPLLDINGNVVGINAEVALRDGLNTGISFAVPIDLARSVTAELIRTGHVDRGELGLGFQDVDPQLSRAFGASQVAGVLVNTIVAGGPAEAAALRVGDIVLALNGKSVTTARQFAVAVASLTPGSSAALTIWRNGVRSDVVLRVAHASAGHPPTASVSTTVSSSPALLAVRRLSTNVRHALGTEGYLLVMGVSERAAAAGIEVGDIILAVDARPVRTDSELLRAVAEGGDNIALLLDRNGEHLFIGISQVDPTRERSANADVTRRP